MEFSPLFKDRVYSVSYVCVCVGWKGGGGGGGGLRGCSHTGIKK